MAALEDIRCAFCGGVGHSAIRCSTKKSLDRAMKTLNLSGKWGSVKSGILAESYARNKKANQDARRQQAQEAENYFNANYAGVPVNILNFPPQPPRQQQQQAPLQQPRQTNTPLPQQQNQANVYTATPTAFNPTGGSPPAQAGISQVRNQLGRAHITEYHVEEQPPARRGQNQGGSSTGVAPRPAPTVVQSEKKVNPLEGDYSRMILETAQNTNK